MPTGQFVGDAGTVDPGPPERLVGVDVADSRHHRLVEELAFDLRMLAPHNINDGLAVKTWIQGVAGDVRHGFGHPAAIHANQFGQLPPAEGALIDEVQRGAVVEHHRDPQVLGTFERTKQHLAAHPQMHHQRGTIVVPV